MDEADIRYIDLLTGNSLYKKNNGKLIFSIRAKQGMILKKWSK